MTAQHGIRLFLADVDGALVTKDKVLTEAAQAAVRELDQAGVAFAIASGRPPRGTDSNESEGFAKAVKKFVLPPTSARQLSQKGRRTARPDDIGVPPRRSM